MIDWLALVSVWLWITAQEANAAVYDQTPCFVVVFNSTGFISLRDNASLAECTDTSSHVYYITANSFNL